MSDPQNPIEISCFDLDPIVWDVYVCDTIAYVTNGSHDRSLIDISDSQISPVEIGYYNSYNGDPYNRVYVKDTIAYVANWGILRIINTANSRIPKEIGFYNGTAINDIYVSDSLIYFTTDIILGIAVREMKSTTVFT